MKRKMADKKKMLAVPKRTLANHVCLLHFMICYSAKSAPIASCVQYTNRFQIFVSSIFGDWQSVEHYGGGYSVSDNVAVRR